MAATLADFGIQAVSTALVEQVRKRKSVTVVGPVLTSAGGFHAAEKIDPMWEFTISGKGDFPTGIAIGEDASPTITDISGGITLIEDTRYSEFDQDYNSWEFSGSNAPGASVPA